MEVDPVTVDCIGSHTNNAIHVTRASKRPRISLTLQWSETMPTPDRAKKMKYNLDFENRTFNQLEQEVVKQTIQIPENVDMYAMEMYDHPDGIELRAPYNQAAREEQKHLHNELRNLKDQSFPGSVLPRLALDENGNKRIYMDFNLRGFIPDEIAIEIINGLVTVEAKRDTKHERGSSLQHFRRVFQLPTNAIEAELVSTLYPNGLLRLEAPCNLKQQSHVSSCLEYIIPVKHIMNN